MAIDASIPLGLKQPESPNMLAQYGQIMGIQNAQNQNALAQYTLAKAKRDDETQGVLDQAFAGAITPEGKIDQGKVMSTIAALGKGSRLPELQSKFATLNKAEADFAKVQIENAKHKAERLSAALAPLVQKGQAITHDDVLAAIAPLEADGTLPTGAKARIPMNSMQLAAFVRNEAAQAEGGRKVMEMFAPKVQMQDTGGVVQALNTNPLAGAIGPLSGATPIKKTNTPGEMLTDERTRSEGAANRGVTIRGQNMTDTRARETLAAGRWTNDLARGLQVNTATGETRPITADGKPIGSKDDAPEAMLKAAGYGDRMKKASVILDKFKDDGTPGVVEAGLAGMKNARGEVPANLLRSPERQQYRQAQEDWVRAKLRQESGAVITDEEMAREIRTYFPAVGDSEAVKTQKERARKIAEQAMVTAAGRAIKSPGATGGWKIEVEK